MKKLLILPFLALLVYAIGCASFSTNVFRMEQTAVTIAYSGYVGWTNYLLTALAKPDLAPARRASLVQASNEVKQARLRFAATVGAVESMRAAYETNSALKPPLQAAMSTMATESSNICWLIQYWRTQ